MGASVEDRIVAMKMENTQFEKGVTQSLASLTRLENALNKGISAKGLDGMQNNLRGFNLNPIEAALSGVSKSWLAMSTIAVTALATITTKAITAGASIVKSLSLDQVLGGFNEYSTNLNSIQTVLANTQAQGTNLDDVNAALQQLNNYSDKTIYNFGEMAKNIGTFTAAGVSLEGSVASIKGIANLAALSGSSSEQASTAMYQLSQAIAAGRVSLQDWNSVVNAGMGGSTFQKALAQTAEAMGTIDSSAVKIEESTGKMTINGQSFRDSISAIGGEKWLTSDVLTKTLEQFTGDMTDAQLAAQGFNKEQIKAIQQTAKTAQDAATKVKTIKQVFDVAKETIGSGWAKTFQNIFGDFEEARTTMTSLSNFLGGIIKSNANARNKVLGDWGKLGGRQVAIEAITNAWQALMDVVSPIQKAFRDIFPAKTGQDLFNLTVAIRNFTEGLSLNETTMDNIRRTFRGVFAVLDIGFQIVSGIFHMFGSLFGVISEGSGGLLNFTGNIGDLLVKFDEWLKKTNGIEEFFEGLGSVLAVPIKLIGDLASAFVGLFGGSNSGGLDATGDALGRVSERLSPLAGILDVVAAAWDRFLSLVRGAAAIFAPVTQAIADVFGGLGTAIANSMSTGDFDPVLDIINTGLLGAITLLFAKFASNGFNFNLFGAGGGIAKSISGSLDALTGSLEAMQANIQAGTLLKIAGAVALITASIVALSLIDSAALQKALFALSIAFGQLLAAMAILVKISGSAGLVKVPAIAAAMVLLASAILILSASVAILSRLSWEELAKGLGAVGVLLLFISGFAASMSMASGPILRVGVAMVPLAVALLLLAGAVKIFATMSWGEMAKGFAGIGAGLLIIAGAMQLMPATLPLTAAGLLLVSIALSGIAASMILFATMNWTEMGKGMVGIAGALLIIAGAMSLMPASLPITAAGLVLVAAALAGIAAVSKVFATMSWEELGKAAAALAGSLLIIAAGVTLMSGALAGAAALVIVAGALAILAPVLVILGAMSWEMIGKGLAVLAGLFVVLGVAGLVLAPLVPVIIALAGAIVLLGLGMALAGAGMLAFGIGLAALAGAGGAGIAVLKQAAIELIQLLPQLAQAMALALLEMIIAIADKAPEMVNAFAKLMEALLEGAIKLVPKFGKLIEVLIRTGLKILDRNQDRFIEAGLNLIIALLTGLERKMPAITDKAGDVAVAFIKGMGKQQLKLAKAGLDALIDFLNGLADAIRTRSADLRAAGQNIASAIIEAILAPFKDLGGQILGLLNDAARSAADNFHFPKISLGNPFNRGGAKVDVIGQYVKELGLVGGSEQVKEAFDNIREGIETELAKTQSIIEKSKDQLEKLKRAGKGDSKEAAKLREEIEKQTKRRKDLRNEQDKWNKKMKDERAELSRLSKDYDTLMANIAAARDALKKAEDDRAAFIASTAQQFNQKPDISAGMSLQTYMQQIARKTAQVKKFMETLAALRAAGLSDEAYQQLLAEGVDAQRLMEQMLAGGGDAVAAYNAAAAALTGAANTLASQASTALYYDAAVASAQATLQGWEDSQPALEAQMTKIARIMVKAIKKALGIRSPSRVFRQIADFTTAGFTGGLEAGIGAVERASEKLGMASLETLQATMNKANSLGVLDMTPTIAPVLDLTQLQKDATRIGTMLATDPMVATVSYEKAAGISNAQQAALDAAAEFDFSGGGDTYVDYTQNLNSPKVISPIDTYRATKSAIPLMKEALDV